MRKLLLAVMMALAAAAHVGRCAGEAAKARYWLPYWGCTDKAALEAMAESATDDEKRVVLKFHLDLAENGDPATWPELTKRVHAAAMAVNPEFAGGERERRIVKQYARNTNQAGKWTRDLVEYSKTYPCSYDYHVGMLDRTEWGWSVVCGNIMAYSYPPDEVMAGIDYLVRQGIALDRTDAEMRDLLRRLNRVFSALLVKDRAWEQIVAQIRTLLETYD